MTGTLTWNANGTLSKIATTDGFNSGGTLTCNMAPTGAVGYDDWSRLLTFDCGSGNWGQSFSYDIYDNMSKSVLTGRTGTSWNPGYGSPSAKNQCTGCTYDSNGNMTSDGSGSNYWHWNQFSKMASYTGTSGAPSCGTTGKCVTYDAFGRIVEQSNQSTWKEYWYTQAGQVQMSGTTPAFGYWPISASGTVYVSGNNSSVDYMHNDSLGNARVVSSRTRTIVTDQAYTPYGEMFAVFGSTGSSYDIFAGITGNFNNGVQWDTPNRELAIFGRWLSPDPAGQGWNQYAYPTNPLSFIDPTGLGECSQYDKNGRPQAPCNSNGNLGVVPGGASCTLDGIPVNCGFAMSMKGEDEFDLLNMATLSVQVQTGWSVIGVYPGSGAITVGGCGGADVAGCEAEEIPTYSTIFPFADLAGLFGPGTAPQGPAANDGSADPTLDARANALAQAINKTGVQTLRNPCTIGGFYVASTTTVALPVAGLSSAAAIPAEGGFFPGLLEAAGTVGKWVAAGGAPIAYAYDWVKQKISAGCNAKVNW